jgi:hypothetical protein
VTAPIRTLFLAVGAARRVTSHAQHRNGHNGDSAVQPACDRRILDSLALANPCVCDRPEAAAAGLMLEITGRLLAHAQWPSAWRRVAYFECVVSRDRVQRLIPGHERRRDWRRYGCRRSRLRHFPSGDIVSASAKVHSNDLLTPAGDAIRWRICCPPGIHSFR